MSGGPSIKNQLDSLSMTVHEVVGRVELNGASFSLRGRTCSAAASGTLLTDSRALVFFLVQAAASSTWWVLRFGRASSRNSPCTFPSRRALTAPRRLAPQEEDRDRLKQVIATQDDILNQRIIGECQNVREDTAHKFSLQIAENRRLSTQLAKALADIQRLTRICENLTTRAQILEANTGIN
jgi:hypothetical protein